MEMALLMFVVAPIVLFWMAITGRLWKYLPPPKDKR